VYLGLLSPNPDSDPFFVLFELNIFNSRPMKDAQASGEDSSLRKRILRSSREMGG
jgi:hypothetical protein